LLAAKTLVNVHIRLQLLQLLKQIRVRRCRDDGFALLPCDFLQVNRDNLRRIPVKTRGKQGCLQE